MSWLTERWPDLAAAPALLEAARDQAASYWARSPTSARELVGPVASGFDPEIEFTGNRRAGLKEAVSEAGALALVEAYRMMGLAAGIVGRHGMDPGGLHAKGEDLALVAVAADEVTLAEALANQRAHGPGSGARPIVAMGTLMGYPRCCVDAFAAQPSRRDNADNERRTFLRAPAEPLDVALHRIGAARVVSHHPCSPSCAASVELGRGVLDRVAEIDAGAGARLGARLGLPALLLDMRRRVELEGRFDGDVFVIERCAPLDGETVFEDGFAPRTLRLSATGVAWLDRAGARVWTDADRPLLTLPGATLSPAALAAIGA